ncbi:MAG: hypothetical protein P1S46_00325 [bacterium]|nr:hypothetical protein [bacterium]MDT8395807.1 hypothetical protein [bacterium]
MFKRRVSEAERRRRALKIDILRERRHTRPDRRTGLYDRRLRFMDRRQRHDESWMGAFDRRIRSMDRRRKSRT